MFGSNYVPYELMGFLVFWTIVVLAVATVLMYLYIVWIRAITQVRDSIWEGKNPSRGEEPDGWRLPAAFVVHVIWSVSKFRTPICWRWKTYKSKYIEE